MKDPSTKGKTNAQTYECRRRAWPLPGLMQCVLALAMGALSPQISESESNRFLPSVEIKT